MTVVQYTYTHKQYRERHKTNNTKNTKIHRTTQKNDDDDDDDNNL